MNLNFKFTVIHTKFTAFFPLFFCAFIPSNYLLAADCNFDKPVGSCTGTIQVVKTYGSKPSYGAELIVSSSVPACSKVEYYIESTPHQTIFKNSSSEPESVHGTKPFSKDDISVQKCTTYEDRSPENAKSSEDGADGGKFCFPSSLVKSEMAKNQHYVQENKWKIEKAKQNKREEESEGSPNRAYIQEMAEFIVTWEPYITDAEQALERGRSCLSRPSCVCQ